MNSRLVEHYFEELEAKRERRVVRLMIAAFCLIMTTIVFWGMSK